MKVSKDFNLVLCFLNFNAFGLEGVLVANLFGLNKSSH